MKLLASAALGQQPSGRQTVLSLLNGTLSPGAGWRRKSYRAKFALRALLALLALPSTLRYMQHLAALPNFHALLQTQTTLPGKPHRPYLQRGLGVAGRAQAIIGHYRLLQQQPCGPLASALSSQESQLVLTLQGKDQVFTVQASTSRSAEREGESTLWLYSADTALANLTFCLAERNGQRAIAIGGLQGPRREVPTQAIKAATKSCFGLFPKRVLMEVLSQLAVHMGITHIEAVSNRGHVFQALRYRFRKGRQLHANYDEFWLSLEGRPNGDYLYTLPAQFPRKPIQEVASHKRSEYRKRYELMDALAQGFRDFLQPPQPGPIDRIGGIHGIGGIHRPHLAPCLHGPAVSRPGREKGQPKPIAWP